MVFPGGLMRLLFVASDPMEYRGIVWLGALRAPGVAVDWVRRAVIHEHEAMLVANGAGPVRAAAAVDAAMDTFRPEAIVSVGFCGALEPALRIGDVVVGTSVTGGGRTYELHPVASGAPHRVGAICSIGHVAQTALEKARLRASGAIAVEMEAAGLGGKAEILGLPFYCVRAVTDLAGEDMANDFSKALRPDGHFDTITILRSALRHPWARVPELIRLRQRCVRAALALGDFIADCRF
jgi:adenosylhomocysteine nucleosidase